MIKKIKNRLFGTEIKRIDYLRAENMESVFANEYKIFHI